jgi:hypothetical protein
MGDGRSGVLPRPSAALLGIFRPIRKLSGKFTAYSPNLGLLNIGGKAAWKFADGDIATIIQDGHDVWDLYSLAESTLRPLAGIP